MLSQTMLGNLAASGAVENSAASSGGAVSRAVAAAVARVPPTRIPALYAALDFVGLLVISLGTLWVIDFVGSRKRFETVDALDATDYTVAVSGLRRGVLSAIVAGDCSCGATPLAPTALVAHLEKIAATFTSDFRVARLADGRPEIYFAGAELRAARLFRKRAELVQALRDRQRDLAQLETTLGLDVSRWRRKTPLYGQIASELGELVGMRARAEKIEADMARLRAEAAESAAREADKMRARKAADAAAKVMAKAARVSLAGDDDESSRAASPRPSSKRVVTSDSTRAIGGRSKRATNTKIYDDSSSQGTAATDELLMASQREAAGRSVSSPRISAPDARRIRQRQESKIIAMLATSVGSDAPSSVKISADGDAGVIPSDNAESPDIEVVADSGDENTSATAVARAAPTATRITVALAPAAPLPFFSRKSRFPVSSVPPAHLVLHDGEQEHDADGSVRTSKSSEDSGFGDHMGSRTADDRDRIYESDSDEFSWEGDRVRAPSWSSEEERVEEEAGGGNWFPAWLGGSPVPIVLAPPQLKIAEVRVRDYVSSPRSGSGRTRPFSRHAFRSPAENSGPCPAEDSGNGAFSEAVAVSVSRSHMRAYAEELARKDGCAQPAVLRSPRVVAVVGRNRERTERLRVAAYSRKSPLAYFGVCGDRTAFDALDVPLPCSLFMLGWRADAYEKRIAWLRGRIDDILWEIDATMRTATSLVPDSDVLEEIGGHSARRETRPLDNEMKSTPGSTPAALLAPATRASGDSKNDAVRNVETEDPVVAYVTFESAQTAAALIQLHSMGGLEFCVRRGQATVASPGPQSKWFSADAEAVAAASEAAKKSGLARPAQVAGVTGGDGGLRRAKSRRSRSSDLITDNAPCIADVNGDDDVDSLKTASLRLWGLRLRFSRPPMADTIIWENLHSSPITRATCNCLVSLFAGLLILFSFALLYGSQVLQSSSSLLNTGGASFCAAVDVAPWCVRFSRFACHLHLPATHSPPPPPLLNSQVLLRATFS
jgi:hypothetical protein